MSLFFLVLSVIFILWDVTQLADNRLSVKYKVVIAGLLILWVVNFCLYLPIVLTSLVV